jgi:imidazolonepropionase-like amidohydrolase
MKSSSANGRHVGNREGHVSLIVLVLLVCAGSLRCQDLLVQSKRIVVAADTMLDDGMLLVRQGKIAYVGNEIPADARGRATVVDYGNAVIVPGFVLAQSTLGQDADLGEGALAFTPDLRVAEAFDRWQEELDPLPRRGVTSVALSASPRNVAGGIAALVKPGKASGTIADPELHLSLSLAQAARNPERQPTSLMGAMDMLRTAFAAARTGTKTGPDAAVLAQVLQGSRRLFVCADTYTELSAALDLAKEFALEPVLVGANEAEKVLPRLLQQKASVVLGTLLPDSRLQQLQLPATLAQAGVPFCFGGSPDQLRLSAVLAVVHGLDRKTALQALTRLPALLLNKQATIGSLRQACAADFLVFSGDPLDLSSAHVATWIDGVRVHGESGKAIAAPVVPTNLVGGQ